LLFCLREAGRPPKLQRRRGQCITFILSRVSLRNVSAISAWLPTSNNVSRNINEGKSSHTSKFRPWKLITNIAFTRQAKAEAFERYLKSGSGHAFANKRLW